MLFDYINTQMGPILHNIFNEWITDIFRCSVELNCGMLILVTTLENNLFETLAASLSLLIVLSPSTIAVVSLEITLFENNGLTTFQKILLSLTFFSFKLLYSLLLFCKSVTDKFLCLVYLPLFYLP